MKFIKRSSQNDWLKDYVRESANHLSEYVRNMPGSEVTRLKDKPVSTPAQYSIGEGNDSDALQIVLTLWGVSLGAQPMTPRFAYTANAGTVALLRPKPVHIHIQRHNLAAGS